MTGLFSPAVRFTNRLSYAQKFIFVGLVICLPPSVAMIFLTGGVTLPRQMQYTMGALAAGEILLVTYLFTALYLSISQNILSFRQAARRLAKGDLSTRIKLSSRDEMTLIADSFNDMAGAIRHMIANVSANAMAVAEATSAFAACSSQVSASSMHQRQAAQGTLAAVESLTQSLQAVSNQAERTEQVSQHASARATRGEAVVNEAAGEMARIADSMQGLARMVESLGARSQQISGAVKTIHEIAEQTNMLALNAAIEAARAGEHGRGFAVVADEVRKLAVRTAEATVAITGMIRSIQGEAESAVASMGDGMDQVRHGVALAHEAGQALAEINNGAQQTLGMISAIVAEVLAQSAASSRIAENAVSISRIEEDNNAAIAQMNRDVDGLDQAADGLQKAISQFAGGTAPEARALVEKAAAYYQAQGRQAAFAAFNHPESEFTARDMYIFVYGMDGTVLAHGGNPALVGNNMLNALDPEGHHFVRDRIRLAQEKGNGWQDYQFMNPETHQVERKTSYIQRVDGLIFGCGIYK